jgi:hypothetical protein
MARWVAVVALLVAVAPLAAAPASADSTAEARLTELVAGERGRAGAGGLAVANDLVDVARRHAARMAAEQRLHHNPRLGDEVQEWEVVGENVGRGTRADDIHAAFMDSPTHRANVLDGRFTQIGVGVVAHAGELWVVEVFRRPSPPTAPPPAPVVAAAAAAAQPVPMPPPPSPAPTTTAPPPAPPAPPAPDPRRPPVAGLPTGPRDPSTEVEVLAVPAVAFPIPEIPPITKLAASLLVVVVAAQAVTLRRLRLI